MTTNSFVADLDARLREVAVMKTKHRWERYLKGDASFRGVKMADTRRVVADLVHDHHLDAGEATSILEHAHACFEQCWSEDKLAGILLLAEHGLHCLSVDHLDDLAAPLERSRLADWNTADWYC